MFSFPQHHQVRTPQIIFCEFVTLVSFSLFWSYHLHPPSFYYTFNLLFISLFISLPVFYSLTDMDNKSNSSEIRILLDSFGFDDAGETSISYLMEVCKSTKIFSNNRMINEIYRSLAKKRYLYSQLNSCADQSLHFSCKQFEKSKHVVLISF